MNRIISLLSSLLIFFTTGCVTTAPVIVDVNMTSKKIALVGHIDDEVVANYQGVTIFENEITKYKVDWNLTKIAAEHVIQSMKSTGFTNIVDLTNSPEFGLLARDAAEVTNFGMDINKRKISILNKLAHEGYDFAVILNDDRTYLTAENSIMNKGVFFRPFKIESSVYGAAWVSLVVLRPSPMMAESDYDHCTKGTFNDFHKLQAIYTNISETKRLTTAEIESLKEPLIAKLKQGLNRGLCNHKLINL